MDSKTPLDESRNIEKQSKKYQCETRIGFEMNKKTVLKNKSIICNYIFLEAVDRLEQLLGQLLAEAVFGKAAAGRSCPKQAHCVDECPKLLLAHPYE
uniref:Uncharacterized protein n=1 Tax=Oryza brachyantha TaxID=4533 RepID=J3MLJ5_ORYBR